MYKITPQKYNTASPWKYTLQERIGKLCDAKKRGKKVVVYLYETPDSSSFRYRVYNVCQALELSLDWQGVFFFSSEIEVVANNIWAIDVLVIARYRWTRELAKLIDKVKNRQIPIAFETDDMVFDSEHIPLLLENLSVGNSCEEYNHWFSYVSRIQKTLEACDCGISTNEFLSSAISKKASIKSYVIKNFMNRLQLDVSDNYYIQKNKQKRSDEFVIGYFSGSPTHLNDFNVASRSLVEILNNYSDVKLRIAGYLELPSIFAKYVREERVEFVPFVNFIDLQKAIAEVDVNIAPLVVNDFTNCKSELKFFEAAAVGTPTCASPTYTFMNAIQSGVDGYILDKDEWTKTLTDIYENKSNDIYKIIENGKAKSTNVYAYYNQVGEINNVFNSIMEDRYELQ